MKVNHRGVLRTMFGSAFAVGLAGLGAVSALWAAAAVRLMTPWVTNRPPRKVQAGNWPTMLWAAEFRRGVFFAGRMNCEAVAAFPIYSGCTTSVAAESLVAGGLSNSLTSGKFQEKPMLFQALLPQRTFVKDGWDAGLKGRAARLARATTRWSCLDERQSRHDQSWCA
jgi:hypothetical protein